MAKIVKKQNPVNKKTCLTFAQAVLAEDSKEATKILKKLVKANISRKLRKAEQETELF